MSRLLALAIALAALPGCLFDSCPYTVDSIARSVRSEARFDVANSTLAEQAWKDLGFRTARDGLTVDAEKDGLQVYMGLGEGGTWMLLRDDIGRADFRSYEEAQEYVDAHMASALQRINATLQAFEGQVDWPPFVPEPAEGSISTC